MKIFISLALLMLATIMPDIHSQSIVLPESECGSSCKSLFRVDSNGTIFILRDDVNLYVSENNAEFTLIDLSQISPRTGIRRDFVPVGDNHLLFFDYQSISELTIFDWREQALIPVDIEIMGNLIECDSSSTLLWRPSIFQVGSNSAIVCSINDWNVYVNTLLWEDDNLSMISSIEVGRIPQLNVRPWIYINGGQDNNLYLSGSRLTIDTAQTNLESNHTTMLRYIAETEIWETIELETPTERWAGEGYPPIVDFVGVDANGNLYMHYSWVRSNSGRGSDLVKYSPSGRVLWQTDESYTNNEAFQNVVLIAEDQILIMTSENNLNILQIDPTNLSP